VALLFFAFTSILANTYYGETSLAFIHDDKRLLTAFRWIVLGGIIAGSQLDLPLVWAMADLSMAFMTVVNLVAVLALSGLVIKVMRDYNAQLALRIEPVFEVSKYPEIARRLVKGSW